MSYILLKDIFIDVITKKKEIILPEINVSTQTDIWQELEKDAKQQLDDKKTLWVFANEAACWCCGLFFANSPYNIPIFISKDIVSVTATDNFTFSQSLDPLMHFHKNKKENYSYLPDATTREEKRTVNYYGIFCSVFCSVRFLEETIDIPPNKKTHYKNLIYYLYSKEVNKTVVHIPPAYPKHLMHIYSTGGWTEKVFREKNRELHSKIIYA